MRRLFYSFRFTLLAVFAFGSATLDPCAVSAEDITAGTPSTYSQPIIGKQKTTPWWRDFNDPTLDKLIGDALKGNFDVKAAQERVHLAEAVSRRNLAPMLPAFSIDVGANILPLSSMQFQQPPTSGTDGSESAIEPPDVAYRGSALLKANLQADIWGRHYLNYSASQLDASAQSADRDAQAAQLASLIAEVYFDTLTAEARLALFTNQLENDQTLLSLMEKRFEFGQVNALEVLQQRQQVAAAQALLPNARAVLETGVQQLNLLTGRSATRPLPLNTQTLPELPKTPATGTPKDLIENLPALRSAVARVRAAEQRADSAFRGLLPKLSVSGEVGAQARYIFDFEGQESWGVGALLSIPLWEGGANHAAVDQANAEQRSAEYALTQSVLKAVTEVESALTREKSQREHFAAVQKQLEAANLAYEEATQRYLTGLDSYLNVLIALNSHQQAQLAVLQSQRDLIMSRVRLYHALGGPWTKGLASDTRETK
jgi:multidrug efflux system outer membrane protein